MEPARLSISKSNKKQISFRFKNGVISEKQKMDYEITCAYTQLENPSQLQQKMISILKEIENARKS